VERESNGKDRENNALEEKATGGRKNTMGEREIEL